MPKRRKCGVGHFFTKLVAMATSLELRYWKRGQDHSSAPKNLSFSEKIVKICPADPEIICLREIVIDKNRKKLTQAQYIARSAT